MQYQSHVREQGALPRRKNSVVALNAPRLAAIVGAASLTILATLAPAAMAQNVATPGAVYTETNSAAGNAVAVFTRSANGALALAGTVPTAGLGTGASLASQGAVALSDDGRWLFAVNAGSNDVSSFVITPAGPVLVDREPSGGTMPVSLTIHGSVLYVLNAGVPNSIAGLWVGPGGSLAAIAGSIRPLSAASTGPAEISFSPSGGLLVVTEKATQTIDTYVIGPDGLASGPDSLPSSGGTPYGFGFSRRDLLIVSEAVGSVSSYSAGLDGLLQPITASAATHQTAACWIATTGNGKYAYTANAGSGSISGYSIGQSGGLTLLDATGITASTGAGSKPEDMAVSVNGRYLNVLMVGFGAVGVFRIDADGSLAPVGVAGGLPSTAVGLAAH